MFGLTTAQQKTLAFFMRSITRFRIALVALAAVAAWIHPSLTFGGCAVGTSGRCRCQERSTVCCCSRQTPDESRTNGRAKPPAVETACSCCERPAAVLPRPDWKLDDRKASVSYPAPAAERVVSEGPAGRVDSHDGFAEPVGSRRQAVLCVWLE